MLKTFSRYFNLKDHGTDLNTEIIAGFTTFLTMAYIIFVNPTILAAAGMDHGAAFVATCIAAAIGCFLIGIMANYPIGIAPGMGLNAYFAYTVVLSMGFSWQSALGMVFIAGILFFILTVSRIRQTLITSIPKTLVLGISAGIGFFLAVIGLKNAGIIISDPNTLVKLGNMSSVSALLFLLGFFLIISLSYYRIHGAIIISILIITLVSLCLKLTPFYGIVSEPPDISSTFLAMNIHEAFNREGIFIIFAFFLVALFDSTGTLVGLLQETRYNRDPKRLQRLSNALMADSISTMAGAVLGTSTATPYVESAAGIKAGGRTGLTAIVIGSLFLLAIFFAPLAKTIPIYATAPALLFVACLMIENISHLEWTDITEYVPAIIIMIVTPLTFSIANGIGFGFISYVFIKLLIGKYRDLNWLLVIFAIIFLIYFIWQNFLLVH
jgi:AGZA family xanthine/uracil permease-like MFS transporter